MLAQAGLLAGVSESKPPSARIAMTQNAKPIVGKVYRLQFPGIAARVIEPPPGVMSVKFPYLVESLFLRSRWWVNELGEPDNIYSPLMMTPAGRAVSLRRSNALASQTMQRLASQ
jgi:hypothetical protein